MLRRCPQGFPFFQICFAKREKGRFVPITIPQQGETVETIPKLVSALLARRSRLYGDWCMVHQAVDRGQGRTGMDDLVFRFILRRKNRDQKKKEPQMAPNTCSASCAQYPHLHEHCRPIGLIHIGDGWFCGGGGWRLGLILCHGIFLLDGLIPAVQYSSVRRICPFQFCVDCLKDSGAIVFRSASY